MREPSVVYVLSDDDAVRDSLDVLLQANSIPARTYDASTALLQDLPTNGCLLISLHAKGNDPIERSHQFRGRGLSLPIIILTNHAPARPIPTNAIILQNPASPHELVAAVWNALADGQS